jgi:choline dehydrogenase
LAPYVASEYPPGESTESDASLLEYARETGTTIFHPVGTCRMGADAEAVVDDRLRVRGIGNLRIADASIMPRLISGNTNAACIVIGEKAAEMILGGG